jgi:hypothetical protein
LSLEAIKEGDDSGVAVGMLGLRNGCEEAVQWFGIRREGGGDSKSFELKIGFKVFESS